MLVGCFEVGNQMNGLLCTSLQNTEGFVGHRLLQHFSIFDCFLHVDSESDIFIQMFLLINCPWRQFISRNNSCVHEATALHSILSKSVLKMSPPLKLFLLAQESALKSGF